MPLLAGLSLLLCSAGVGLHLDQVGELSLEEGTGLALRLGRALEPRAGGAAVLDDPLWPECTRKDRCAEEVRQRTQSKELVYLQIYGGPTKIRLIADRLQPSGFQRSLRNLPRDKEHWDAILQDLAVELFPEVLPPLNEEVLKVQPRPAAPPSVGWVPLIPVGAAVVLAGVGGGFGLSSAAARDRIEQSQLSGDAYNAELSTMRTHGTIANVLFGTAIVGVFAGVVLWVLSD